MDIDFRIAGPQDIPVLCRARKTQLLHEGLIPVSNIDEELSAFFCDALATGQLYEVLATRQETVVATGAVCFYSYPPTYSNKTGRVAYITNMFTTPAYRNRGLATKILALLETEIRRRGVTVIRLHTSRLGRPVYEDCGYQPENDWLSKRLTP